jgi:dipeptidyl aminopeptidase/acylaminoacyl peptidase
MRRSIVLALTVSLSVTAVLGQQQRRRQFTAGDLLKIRRVADPQVSPDGRLIAYTITDIDEAANRGITQIYLTSIDGKQTERLTEGEASSHSPRWSPDGKKLAFISMRDGSPQVWILDLSTRELKKITDISTGADGPVWSPDGRWIAFASEVYPECQDEACNRNRIEQANKSKAKIVDRLLYRHWNFWKDGKRTHILIVPSQGGPWRDLTPGDADAPPFSLGGPIDYAFSPDSRELAFARNTDKMEAISTNGDIFVVSISDGQTRRITDNPANDLSPQYSPDGRYIAYRAQSKPGFESDRWRLMLYDRKTGQTRPITEWLDSWVEEFAFSPDGGKIYLVAPDRGRQPIYEVATSGANPKKLIADGFNADLKVTPDGKSLVFTRQSLASPAEIFRASTGGGPPQKITHTNDQFLAGFNLKVAEDVWWDGAEGAKVHGFLVKPADFNLGKKWPLLVLIHGGPQSAWNDTWSYRWNAQVFASAGYLVFLPNPRGSVGYGQKFVDEISGDWAGKVFVDLKNGVAHLASLPYVDRERIGAAGGSYGGYMINWIAGHNDDPRFKFKALVSHAGVYNLVSMYGSTEELWFPEWEFKGTPWTNPDMYARWSPHNYARNFKTPTLVIHGELDYRVPVTEGLQMFTALQRQGVQSKLLYFPDEGHWILKPQNSRLWYETVLGWLDAHL